ncbi:MAG: FAD-dependent monooxygenase [Steroidobacteraceae bacterium]
MNRIRNALIVGGGIGGLSAAIALRRQGIDVDVAEIRRDWTVYHVGVVVQANCIRALQSLGIADEAVACGFPYNGLTFQDTDGKVLARIPGNKLAGPDYPTHLGMTRPALHELLTRTAREAGARLHAGLTYQSFTQSDDAVHVKLSDGSERAFDLVVGADGVYSQLRRDLFGAQYQPHFTGQGTWRYNVRRPPELTSSFVAMGAAIPFGKCGFIPLSADTGYVWLVQSEPGNPRHPPEQLAAILRERLAGCTGILAQLREQIVDPALVVYRPLESLLMPAPWYVGRILLIGDAAHATTPHMGQGAAQAVEDAVVVGEIMGQDAPIATLMEQFMQRRYERCRFIVESSLQIGAWEQNGTANNPLAVELTKKMVEVVAAPL